MRDRLGKFEILRPIGKGAMGEVYLGRDTKLGREVALKVIHGGSAFGAEAQERFDREARAAAALNHPNVVTVFEFGEDEGIHFLVMEYVEGEELEALIQGGKAPKDELLEILAQVCDGLAYAHGKGVIHRDIKPSNVLVTRHGNRAHAKLMDFGVAQMGASNLTQSGIWMGTVNYMAPEYLDSGKASASSDLFAMGVMLYEVLTGGRKPFLGDTATSVLNRILLYPPEPMDPQVLTKVPGQMMTVVERALAKNPGDRYPDADAMAKAIRDGLAAPIELPPPALPKPAIDISTSAIRVGRAGQGQCLSLKVALRNTKPGGEIHVMPGVYRESVVVDKDVTILGLGEASEVIIEGSGGPAFHLKGRAARLRGLTIRAAAGEAAVHIAGCDPILDGCVIEGSAACAVLEAGATPLFKGCTFRAQGGLGVQVGEGAQARLEHGSVEDFGPCGLHVGPGAQAVLQGVSFKTGCGVGLRVQARGQAVLDSCSIEGAQASSVEVEPDGRVQLSRCRLSDSRFAGVLALERSHAMLENCEVTANTCSGIHVLAGANVMMRQCRIHENPGFGLSVMDRGLATLDQCQIQTNGGAGLLIHHGATVQARGCLFSEGLSLGVDCAEGGQGVLDGCEIVGNAGVGVQVESGGNLLLVRCTLKEGRDTGLLLLEDSQVTLEECVLHRNSRGGILLARDAADPVMRGANRIEDGLQRVDANGNLVKVAPLGHG